MDMYRVVNLGELAKQIERTMKKKNQLAKKIIKKDKGGYKGERIRGSLKHDILDYKNVDEYLTSLQKRFKKLSKQPSYSRKQAYRKAAKKNKFWT